MENQLPAGDASSRIASHATSQALSILHSPSTLPIATDSTSKSTRFDKSKYDSIKTGRALNPVDHPYRHQAEISLHLNFLAIQNRLKLDKLEEQMSREQLSMYEVERGLSDVKAVERKCLPVWIYGQRDHWHLGDGELGRRIRCAMIKRNLGYWDELVALARAITNSPTVLSAAPYLDSMWEIALQHHESVPLENEFCETVTPRFHDFYSSYPSYRFIGPNAIIDQTHAAKWTEQMDTFRLVAPKYRAWKDNHWRMIGEIRKVMGILRREEKRCIAASEFAEMLAVLESPFEFFRLPEDLQCAVYKKILIFDYNITVTTHEVRQGSGYKSQNFTRSQIWSHPIFRVSSKLREEAGLEFYRFNTFSCGSLKFLPVDLGRKCIAHYFRKNIKKLAIPMVSLDRDTIKAIKAIKALEGLRELTVYINSEQLTKCPLNTMGGLKALETSIRLPNSELPFLESVKIYDMQLSKSEIKYKEEIEDPEFTRVYFGGGQVNTIHDGSHTMVEFGQEFSTRVLNTKGPGTVYSHGRQPRNPTILWPKLEASQKRKNEKRPLNKIEILPDLDYFNVRASLAERQKPVSKLLNLFAVKQMLDAIAVSCVERRKTRLAMFAEEEARVDASTERQRINRERLHSFIGILPFFYQNDPSYNSEEDENCW